MKRDFSLLAGRQFDLLVVGGGIYGAWTAYDAALRGLKVAIVEQGDWAGATSSASSKLIHGGLRYLETYDFKLVRKALREREALQKIAPHRVWPLQFAVPVYEDGRTGRLKLKAGLMLYDALAGFPDKSMAHHRFSRAKFAGKFPFLDQEKLVGGFTYGDAQTDDARLVLELVAGAMQAGAVCVNYCRMQGLIEENGSVCGASVQDVLEGVTQSLAARQVVNTSGPWIAAPPERKGWCRLSKGIHLVLPALPANEALLLTAKSDGRVFFIIPWYGMTLLGTTDTDYRGAVDRVTVEQHEIDYLLNEANHYLKSGWTRADVVGSFAGVRTMKYSDDAHPSSASRDWELKTAENGVHYSIGGKLTSAREDASNIVDKVCSRLGVSNACNTRVHPFPWTPSDHAVWMNKASAKARQLHIDEQSAAWLLRRHGKRIDEVFKLIERNAMLSGRINPDLPFIYADLLLCARDEMVVHLDDLIRRRMPLLILARWTEDGLRGIAGQIAEIHGWEEARIGHEIGRCLQS